MKIIRAFFSSAPKYMLWIVLSTLFWLWIFTLITDTSQDKKVTLFADVPALADPDLSVVLEESMPEGIKMVRARSFSYLMFNDSPIGVADIFIVRQSDIEEFRESFALLDPEWAKGRDGLYPIDGEPCGLLVYDAETDTGYAQDYITYAVPAQAATGSGASSADKARTLGGSADEDPSLAGEAPKAPEDCYLFFGANSLHCGRIDDAAYRIADAFLALGPGPDAGAYAEDPGAQELGGEQAGDGEAHFHVDKVEGLPADFIFGMDASCVPALEESGVVYRDADGNEADVFETLADAGITHIRVRIWNDPRDEYGRGYGGGNCDIENAVLIARRAAAAGLALIVDFHYSDFWADPGKQKAPKAWEDLALAKKAEVLGRYTEESLARLADTGARIDIVQVGNETNGALCGEKTWDGVLTLMTAGCAAVRKACPQARTALHFTNPERSGFYADVAKRLDDAGVDYDIFASSYYPFWHGTLENLSARLSDIHEQYGKDVMVIETSYPYTAEDSDHSDNTVKTRDTSVCAWPFDVQGQADAVRAVIDTVAHTPGGVGVCYWEGTWIGLGGSRAINEKKWEQFGSGWATSFAGSYDPDDAGRYYGGCAVDNQAMFDPSGRPLDSLSVFRLCR